MAFIVVDFLSLLRSFDNLFAIILQALCASHLHLPIFYRTYGAFLGGLIAKI